VTASVHLVSGADPALRDRLVDELIKAVLGDDDRSLALEDHTLAGRRRAGDDDSEDSGAESVEQPVFRRVVNALESPPLMTSKRVVVLREIGALTAEQVAVLVDWIARPVETTVLVLVAGGGRTSPRIAKALKDHGGETHTPAAEAKGSQGDGGAVGRQLALSAREVGVRITPEAEARVVNHLGDDAGRVPELVATLRATFGPGATITLDDVEPYLGGAGTAARFELANAIDRGDVAGALAVLDRLLRSTSAKQPRPLHPLQVLAQLQYHYRSLARLDDPAIVTKEQAAAVLGGSPWAAKHRLDAARALGGAGLAEAYRLLARADIDLRGASGAPEDTVVEVLVARLAALSGRRGARRR
jgi:DNA polymerase-3 subunit delta